MPTTMGGGSTGVLFKKRGQSTFSKRCGVTLILCRLIENYLCTYLPVDCWQVASFFRNVLLPSGPPLRFDDILESERLGVPLARLHRVIAATGQVSKVVTRTFWLGEAGGAGKVVIHHKNGSKNNMYLSLPAGLSPFFFLSTLDFR